VRNSVLHGFLAGAPEGRRPQLTIYALLDSKGIVGAYRFDIRPGSTSQVEVMNRLYPAAKSRSSAWRRSRRCSCIGENSSGRRFDDFRLKCMTATGCGE